MSICPNVTKEDMVNSAKLAENKKIRGEIKFENCFSNKLMIKKLAENFKPKTKKLTEVHKVIGKLVEIFIKSPHLATENLNLLYKLLRVKHMNLYQLAMN